MSTETAWLIERNSVTMTRPQWWAGVDAWTTDNLAAVRFAREQDGHAVLRTLTVPRETQHQWG